MTVMDEAFKKAYGNVEDVTVKATSPVVEHPQDLGIDTGTHSATQDQPDQDQAENESEVILRKFFEGLGVHEEFYRKALFEGTGFSEETLGKMAAEKPHLLPMVASTLIADATNQWHAAEAREAMLQQELAALTAAAATSTQTKEIKMKTTSSPATPDVTSVPEHRTVTVKSESFGTQAAKAAGVAVVTAVAVWGTFKVLGYFFGEDENTL
jgi:hypothetical protein